MRPLSMILPAIAALGAGFLLGGPAFAAPKHHKADDGGSAVYSKPAAPERSWLDPGSSVEEGTGANYVSANTIFNQTPDQAYFPSRFQEDNLPRPFYPTGESRPVVRFWTPSDTP